MMRTVRIARFTGVVGSEIMKSRKLVVLFGVGAASCFLAFGSTKSASAQNPPSGPPPVLLMNFYGDDDVSQCNALAYGVQAVQFGQSTSPIVIDTDNRRGGCIQQFAILDPGNLLAGLKVKIKFVPDGDRQCDNPGEREIPIRRDVIQWSSGYRIDTDNRRGGCQQTFSIEGRTDVALDVYFTGYGGDPGQCGNAGLHTAFYGQPVQLRIDTDGRPGGCLQQFNLHARDPLAH